ncbi:MAG: hydantoinase/oxoprolinase N-terminal domain-containing protein [Anaerolineae bacterium]
MTNRDYGLGIDTGGTFTDAAIVDMLDNSVVAAAKAPTTRHDLSVGISNAIGKLPAEALSRVGLASLSTTLATNAIVEGNGAPTCLVLIGYDPQLIAAYNLNRLLPTANLVYVAGGHTTVGAEREPLDEAAIARAAQEQKGSVAAFAVSGFFAVRNPEHELRARQIIAEATGLPVTCGHELATELDSVLRAATCALNASLVPLLRDLMGSVQRSLHAAGMDVPLMVVRGDGSLMRVEVAVERPVETILSGPAASVVGARALTQSTDMLVVDIGGTTTDLAVVRDGLPQLNSEGATVGRWRTLVRAVETVSSGLGGDSQVSLDGRRPLQVGPRRVVPLSFVAGDSERVRQDLARALDRPDVGSPADGDFFLLVRQPDGYPYSDLEQRILRALQSGPQPLWRLALHDPWVHMYLSRPNLLERTGMVMRGGFTPTDALHVTGAFTAWDREAAILGARLFGRYVGAPPEEVADLVLREVQHSLVRALAKVLLHGKCSFAAGGADDALMSLALGESETADLEVSLTSRLAVVGLGAPAGHFVLPAARLLHAEAALPQHHAVANAVGAICGSVVVREVVQVQAIYEAAGLSGYVVTGAFPAESFDHREPAEAWATERALAVARANALAAGAADVEVKVDAEVHDATASPSFGDRLYLGSTIVATAVGRPRFAHEAPAPVADAEEVDLW